jgi:hypothetical protein
MSHCPACKKESTDDPCHQCGRTLSHARRLDLCLDFALTATLVAFSWVVLLWLDTDSGLSEFDGKAYDLSLYSLWNGRSRPRRLLGGLPGSELPGERFFILADRLSPG